MTKKTKKTDTPKRTTIEQRVAAVIKRERLAAGASQASLAYGADLSVSYISMLERGQRSPPLSTLERIADALGVTVAKLVEG